MNAYTPPMALTPSRRSELRAQAHKLDPVVIIGDKGLTDEVVAEIDRSLKAHELIKVRAATDDRKARDEWLHAICERLEAHPVQQIGKVFVIYRENPEEPPKRREPPAQKPPRRRGGPPVSARGSQRQRARDEAKRRERDIADMIRKGKIELKAKKTALKAKSTPGLRREEAEMTPDVKRTSRPRSRTPSPLPASELRRRRPRTSR